MLTTICCIMARNTIIALQFMNNSNNPLASPFNWTEQLVTQWWTIPMSHPISGSAHVGFFVTHASVWLTGLYWAHTWPQSTLSSGTEKRFIWDPGYGWHLDLTCGGATEDDIVLTVVVYGLWTHSVVDWPLMTDDNDRAEEQDSRSLDDNRRGRRRREKLDVISGRQHQLNSNTYNTLWWMTLHTNPRVFCCSAISPELICTIWVHIKLPEM